MKRSSFLQVGSTAVAALLIPRLSNGQPITRAAVVVGVDRAGTLPQLRAAASGAKAFADWLSGEGFSVTRFIDEPGKPVRVSPIFDAIYEIVDQSTVQQLVVYFSGHGFLTSYSELWMLSGAPINPNEAISLQECEVLARRSGIPNVVFISDACRSTPASLAANAVRGNVIFPNLPSAGSASQVDVFLAAQPGDPAYEVGVDESVGNYYGIYTESFLQAFRSPETSMVTVVDGDPVILNRDLDDWLKRDVSRRAQMASLAINQIPETRVTSDQYIGHVKRSGGGGLLPHDGLPPVLPEAPATFGESSAMAFAARGFDTLASDSIRAADKAQQDKILNSKQTRDFDRAEQKITRASRESPKSFETQTGLYVYGSTLHSVSSNPDFMHAELAPEKAPGAIRLHPIKRAPASVAIRFGDGSGTVVAALPGYIGTIVVDKGRVVSVIYDRSGSPFGDAPELKRLDELRSLVATSARFGVFRISGSGPERQQRAEALGDKIRMLKAIDPTLGIYAAYAYYDADLIEKVVSVEHYMAGDIGGRIFDVTMLANKLSGNQVTPGSRIAPFCPALSQGWGLLRVSGVELHPLIDEARDHRTPALWTTFQPTGMDCVVEDIEKGLVA
ncbi:MAG: caspase family protein [Chloroflexota bacterium]